MELERVSYSRVPLDMATADLHSDPQAIDLENDRLLSGRSTPVVGNDEEHIAGHSAIVDSDIFRGATSQGQLHLLFHMAMHVSKKGDSAQYDQRSE